MKAFLLITSIIFISFSCSNKTKEKGNGKSNSEEVHYPASESSYPDSTLFHFKHLSRTPDGGNFSLFSKMNSLDSNQVKTWIQPILKNVKIPLDYKKSGFSVKMVSFQKKTKRYTSIIIALTFDEVQQFYATVDTSGKVIDGLKVSYIKNLSNSDVEFNKERALFKFSTKVISCFYGDTIRVFSIEDVSKLEAPHENKDTWKELYETKYIVKQDGVIQLLSEKIQVDSSKIDDLQ